MTIVLRNMKALRVVKGLTPAILSAVTGIRHPRLTSIENLVGIEEPWLDEAALVARALCTDGIAPLFSMSGDLTSEEVVKAMDFPLSSDLDLLRSGARLPLTEACRIAVKLGLPDPEYLLQNRLHVQVWDTISERRRVAAALGGGHTALCPWCLEAAVVDAQGRETTPHLPTCLPNNLWGVRDAPAHPDVVTPRPRSTSKRRSGAGYAKGLAELRARAMKTQKQMADAIGINANHYARVERGEAPLKITHAESYSQLFKVDVAKIYAGGI